MQSPLTNLALLIAVLALVVSAYAVTRTGGSTETAGKPAPPPQNVADLERRVELLIEEVKELQALRPAPREPHANIVEATDPTPGLTVADTEAAGEALQAMVDVAVEKKARSVTEKLRMKADKKPPIDAFAAVLELSDAQRASVEQAVSRGQHEAYTILGTPTDDGTNLMNDLVELVAESMANPGKDAGWGKWIGRVLSEKLPGTDDTYATRIEAVKRAVRDNFRQILTEKQYGEFESWNPDPIDIRGIPGSPGEDLRVRIEERARELGATIPGKEGR